jgi:hypothetical protein
MSEKKEIRKLELVGGGLTKEEVLNVSGGAAPACLCVEVELAVTTMRMRVRLSE